MQFTTLLTTVAILASSSTSVFGAPAPVEDAAAIDARAPTTLIDLWQDHDFLGLKYTGTEEPGECVNLPSGFRNNVSSGKARPGWRCTVWPGANCMPNPGFSFNNVGSSGFPAWVNNNTESWKCVR